MLGNLWPFGPVSVITPANSQQEATKPSFRNVADATTTRSLLHLLDDCLSVLPVDHQVPVLVIGAYSSQVELLQEVLEDQVFNNFEPKVCTVDAAQGQQASVVIINTTRTAGSGFWWRCPRPMSPLPVRSTQRLLLGGRSQSSCYSRAQRPVCACFCRCVEVS